MQHKYNIIIKKTPRRKKNSDHYRSEVYAKGYIFHAIPLRVGEQQWL